MRKWAVALAVVLAAGVLAGVAVLYYNGIWQFNNPSLRDYPVRGVDVSSYQGEIDWPVLAGQGIAFAFIKATEGSSLTDTTFARNFEEAQRTGLRIGAYHFFSFDSSGRTQAEHFIEVVPRLEGALPPVIDLEYYGDKAKYPPAVELVRDELRVLSGLLSAHYGVTPILYATAETYDRYLSGAFLRCDIWIRDVFRQPTLADGRAWTFWQYSNRVKLQGYQGKEQYIDMNAFGGSAAEFAQYGLPASGAN